MNPRGFLWLVPRLWYSCRGTGFLNCIALPNYLCWLQLCSNKGVCMPFTSGTAPNVQDSDSSSTHGDCPDIPLQFYARGMLYCLLEWWSSGSNINITLMNTNILFLHMLWFKQASDETLHLTLETLQAAIKAGIWGICKCLAVHGQAAFKVLWWVRCNFVP